MASPSASQSSSEPLPACTAVAAEAQLAVKNTKKAARTNLLREENERRGGWKDMATGDWGGVTGSLGWGDSDYVTFFALAKAIVTKERAKHRKT